MRDRRLPKEKEAGHSGDSSTVREVGMLKGDLTSTPLVPLLVSLAEEPATGCLHLSDEQGDEALIYYRTGLVYAVSVPGRRPQLGAKLVSSGALAPEALAEALEVQRTELQGWRLGELLVHLGFVDQPVVEAFVKEQIHDALWDLISWGEGRWRFRRNEKTREDVAPAVTVTDLLTNLRDRGVEWEAISTVVHGPTAVPVLSSRGGGAAEMTLDADAWSMLCKIDGERSLAELARDCGYTLFEAGQVVLTLVQAGLVDIEEDLAADTSMIEPEDGLYGATSVSSALAAVAASLERGATEDAAEDVADIARLASRVAAGVREGQEFEEASPIPLHPVHDEQSFAHAIERVSSALADVLGPAPVADPYDVPAELRRSRRTSQPSVPAVVERDVARRDRLRSAAAEELAAAHALAEELRAAGRAERATLRRGSKVARDAEVVDLAAVRKEAEEAARLEAERVEAERVAAEEAARVEAERVAAEEAARIEAERLEAERLEAERLEAERLEAERLEAERLEAERLAAEEAARIEAERVEAERLAAEEAARVEAERVEAERLAAEEAARVEAERVEAGRLAAEEAARVEAERVEAERLAAEEAARLEAERVAAEEAARVEAERVAAEEAARIEAERLETERLAAEEAARIEAERVAAEEAARAAELAEAEEQAWTEYWAREAAEYEARVAADEAERLAAEEAARLAETERVAAEEAARQAAEQAQRRQAEEEQRRAAEEAARQAEAERLAAEEAERVAAEAASLEAESAAAAAKERHHHERSKASALLSELSQDPVSEPAQDVEPEPEPAPEPEPDRQPAYAGAAGSEMADTAALLRELSSLGLDDDPAPAAASPPPPRMPSRPAPAAPAKKKRGLFGR